MKFVYQEIASMITKLLMTILWIANVVLNAIMYSKWQTLHCLVMCVLSAIWLLGYSYIFVSQLISLKKFCENYDEQVKKLLEKANINDEELEG